MTPKVVLPAVWVVNLALVAGLTDSAALLAVGFIIGQGMTLLALRWWIRAERADRKAWTDALTEAHTSAQALIRAADLRHMEMLKPPSKEIA